VCLTVSNPCGTDSVCHEIIVLDVDARFRVSDSVVCPGDTVMMTNISTGGLTFRWFVEDALWDTATHSEWIPDSADIYDLLLVADNGFCTDSFLQTIKVVPLPTAAFEFVVLNEGFVQFSDSSDMADSLSWHFGDGQFSNLDDPLHLYVDSGFYTVCLMAFNDCGWDSVCRSIGYIHVSTGVATTGAEGVRVFPNPAFGRLRIEIEANDALPAITLHSTAGRLIEAATIHHSGSRTWLLDAASCAPGVYFLQIKQGGKQHLRRVIFLK